MKIHLIGAPGSGTSSVAARLSAQFQLPLLDLDSLLQHTDAPAAGSEENSHASTLPLLAAFIAQPGWIVQGSYRPGLLASFQRADRIIALTPSRGRRQTRLVRSFLLGKLTGDARAGTLRSLRERLACNRNYDRDQFPAMHALLVRQDLPYSRCVSFAEVLKAVTTTPEPPFTPVKTRACRWHA